MYFGNGGGDEYDIIRPADVAPVINMPGFF